MGLFPINGSTIGKALAITPNNTIDARSAWLFENQTGTLGTNLNSSVLYVGVTGDILYTFRCCRSSRNCNSFRCYRSLRFKPFIQCFVKWFWLCNS